MKVTYIGDPNRNGDGPDTMLYHGIKMPKGEAVDVTDKAVLAKLRGNNHFEVAEAEKKPAPKKPAPKKPADGDGNGDKD